jgi:hypothetical protein
MHPVLTKRFQVPEVWFSAFLFSFKLFTVGVAVLLLTWYVILPSNHSNAQTGFDHAWYFASDDFAMVAFGMSPLYFLAAAILVIGGLIQLFKYSRRAALWSIAFGVFALIVGIFLAAWVSSPEGYYEIFRSVG